MYNRHLVLVCDRETGDWSIMHESINPEPAVRAAEEKRATGDDSPMILLDTSDYINF